MRLIYEGQRQFSIFNVYITQTFFSYAAWFSFSLALSTLTRFMANGLCFFKFSFVFISHSLCGDRSFYHFFYLILARALVEVSWLLYYFQFFRTVIVWTLCKHQVQRKRHSNMFVCPRSPIIAIWQSPNLLQADCNR